MANTTHRIRVADARRVRHPAFPLVEKHHFTVRAKDVPSGIRSDANAREATGINRQVYKDVKESLLGHTSTPGTFDLMNKGITILATAVTRIADDTYDITIADGQGIVDGGHTYRIITENQDDPDLPDEQHVEIQVRTGISDTLITDIARGLNTGIQVQEKSLANLGGAFDWLKEEIRNEPYAEIVSWREGDAGDYDVRDLLSVLEALNVFDFPNEDTRHPVHAYEKWSVALGKFAKDYEEHKADPTQMQYYKLKGLLRGGLSLYDTIRRDFRDFRNQQGGRGGRLKIVEGPARKGKEFTFPFAQLEPSEYRLTKGAAMPILAAFRNVVQVSPTGANAVWAGGFPAAQALWRSHGGELVAETVQTASDFGNLPDQLGKNRGHWAAMHKTIRLRVLEKRLISASV